MSKTNAAISIVVLAAGKGTRMKSELPKVMHRIAGMPMLGHVLRSSNTLSPSRTIVVTGPGMDLAAAFGSSKVETAVQSERLGTAHAVQMAQPLLSGFTGRIIVLYGDTPFVRPETLKALVEVCEDGADIGILGFDAADPTGYGRLILKEGNLVERIVEHKDATETEREIPHCNSGVLTADAAYLFELLSQVGNDNAKGEYYLTDVVALARARGDDVRAIFCPEAEVLGVNSREELAEAEVIAQTALRRKAMDEGVTLQDPQSVFLSSDTSLGRDIVIEPHVYFGPGVTVEDNVTIRAFSHLEGTTIRRGASVGPFARLRPAADIGPDAKIGNFVEVKKATVEEGAKISHLSYIGDARVGAHANIGAGTITCNYDGFDKFFTDIGAHAFIGSNSALVAPVKIGDGAYTGSGSVITTDIEDDALGVARGRQRNIAGWAAKFRSRKKKTDKA